MRVSRTGPQEGWNPKILFSRAGGLLSALAFGWMLFIFPLAGTVRAEEAAPPSSRASVLMEADTGQILSGREENTPLPMGTLAKLMTVLLTAEALDAGKLSLDAEVAASAKANAAKGAVIWLTAGEKMSVEDLLKGVIIGNANDASIALAEAVSGSEEAFVKRMNDRARELGMEKTRFQNCTGLDAENQVSTAAEMALLTRELARRKELTPYFTCWMDTLRGDQTQLVNANTLVRSLKGILGFKAGNTEASGWCLSAAAERDGTCYIAVILGAPDKDSRFTEGKQLLNTGFSNYQLYSPQVPREALEILPVKGGVWSGVPLVADVSPSIVLPKGTLSQLETRTERPEFLEAPLKEGQAVGKVVYLRDGKELCSINLLTGWPVEEMTIWKALQILLKNTVRF